MTAPLWQAGTLYPFGSIVQPQSVAPPVSTVIPNAGFESGDVDWTKDAGWTINNTGDSFTGTWSAEFNATATGRKITSATLIAVTPGQSITATCQVQQGASSSGQAGARVALAWYDSLSVELSESLGTLIDSASGGAWRQSTVTGIAPAGAAFVAVRAVAFRTGGSAALWVDTFAWNYVAPASLAGLIYKAVQPTTGASGTTEPVWPSTVGVQVVDNEVTWECIAATRVTWEAHPLLVSGSPEPTWPTVPGGTVADGNLVWVASSRRVEDENCPNTKVVAIIASHVFAVDVDIVRFSAAINPLDWTSEANAGFLPTGLQQANANNMAVLGTYRKNLVPMNANVLQLWAMDPDPELMQPIDQLDGIGSIYHWAATAVADDLFYLAALGVRSVSMSGASRNLSSGDIGEPVDELVQEAMAAASAAGIEPIGAYYPSLGQYLLAFGAYTLQIGGELPAAFVGVAIDAFSYQADGGAEPYVFSIVLGGLPSGLFMDASGKVTGTPSETGSFSWTVQVEDALGKTTTLTEGAGGSYVVGISPPLLVTNTDSFDGTPAALTVGAAFTVPTGSGSPVVRVTSDGLYAAFSRTEDTGSGKFGWKKWNIGTGVWDVLPNPASLPANGPWDMAWSHDDRFLACGVFTGTPNSLVIYERVGDTLTQLAQSVFLPNNGYFVAWSADDSMLAVGNGASNKGVCVFDVTNGVLSNLRFNTDNVGGGMQPAFSPDGLYVAAATRDAGLYIYDHSTSPMTLLDSGGGANPLAWGGCHWNDDGIITVADQGSPGFSFVQTWTFDGTTISAAGGPASQPPNACDDSALTSDGQYLAAACTNGTVYVYDLTNFAAPALVETQAVAGSVQTVAWGLYGETPPPTPVFTQEGTTEVFVYTRQKIGNLGSWSRYVFPFAITEFDLLGNQLYFRHGDVISLFDAAVAYDELTPGGTQVPFPGAVYWNYLDCGQPGSTKGMTAFDFVGTGVPSFSVGWDERDWDLATEPYAIDPDTLPGGIIPLNVWGPSLSMRVDFAAGTPWSLSSVIIYVDDMGNGP